MSFLHFTGLFSHSREEPKRKMKIVLDFASICSLFLGHLVWPLALNTSANIWFLPFSILLISLRSWENFVAKSSPFGELDPRHAFLSTSYNCIMKNSFQLTFNFWLKLRKIFTIHATKFTCSYHR